MARKKVKEQYSTLTIKVRDFSGQTSASINYEAKDLRYRHEKTPVYRFSSIIEFEGTCTYPPERLGDSYGVTVHSAEAGSKLIEARLEDYHLRDEQGAPRYGKQRDRLVPIYEIPPGLGLLQKVRGEARWNGWIWVPEQTVAQMLTLAASGKQLYIEMIEHKAGRSRWITHLTVQTTDPAE